MPKNDNAHSIRMVESLKTVIGDKEANEFGEKYPLSKSANANKKFEWAKEACKFLEKKYDKDTNMRIREKCICNDGKSTAVKMLKYLKQTNSISEFVDSFNDNENFASLEYINNNKIMFCYPECYCGCIKRVNEQLPEVWCYCTLGYAKSVFAEVFSKEVKVELVESIKMGDQRCAVNIEW
jgi:hypothetical protein